MSFFIDPSNLAGMVFMGLVNITGSFFLALLVVVLLIMALFFMFRIPLEFTAILILPMLIVFLSYEGEVLSVAGVFLIYLGILVAKNLPFRG